MKRLTTAELERLSTLLLDAFPSVVKLDLLLRSGTLDKRFDRFASPNEPLADAVTRIVFRAADQGWALPLLQAAMERREDVLALRQLYDSLPDVSDEPPAPTRADRPSLGCGRSAQWNGVCQCAPARVHNVIVVHGHADQDPVHFRERIHFRLDVRPARATYVVNWGEALPASRAHFQQVLATTLKADAARVREAFADRLAAQDLVLIHPAVHPGADYEELLRYYTMYLPELLTAVSGDGRLKCVQPIEWIESGRGFLQRIGLGDDEPGGRAGAVAFVEALKSREHPLLAIADLDELTNLTGKELADFAKFSGLPGEKQKRLLQRAGQVPQVSKAIFEAIDDYWWREVQAAP